MTLLQTASRPEEDRVKKITEPAQFRLDTNVRCDRRGAQAFYEVTLVTEQQLMFCSHHYRESKEGLAKINAKVRDESAQLVKKDTE